MDLYSQANRDPRFATNSVIDWVAGTEPSR